MGGADVDQRLAPGLLGREHLGFGDGLVDDKRLGAGGQGRSAQGESRQRGDQDGVAGRVRGVHGRFRFPAFRGVTAALIGASGLEPAVIAA